MRTRIYSPLLKERFRTAWGVLPPTAQTPLRSFIRYVDEWPELEGACIYGRLVGSKSIELIDLLEHGGTGYAVVMDLARGRIADVLLPTRPLATCDEGMALAIILHELAHAWDYRNNGHAAADRGSLSSEQLAWDQAVSWARNSDLSYELTSGITLYAQFATLADIERAVGRLLVLEELSPIDRHDGCCFTVPWSALLVLDQAPN